MFPFFGLNPAQFLSLLFVLVFGGIVTFRLRKNHFARLLDYPRMYWSLTWAMHTIVFYIFTALESTGIVPDTDMLVWSSYLRLHGALTFLYIELVELYYWNKRRKKQ